MKTETDRHGQSLAWRHTGLNLRRTSLNLRRGSLDARRGFTLIEMLVVIAILGILFGLLFIPVTNGFKFVGQERVEIDEQNLTREVMRIATGEISQAMLVQLFPATTIPGNRQGHSGSLPPNPTRIDLVMPVEALLNHPGINPPGSPVTTGLEPGIMRETLFVGLSRPDLQYENLVARKVTGGLANALGTNDNLYTVWRAIYNPNDPKDPVAQFIQQNYGGNQTTALSDPWFFDDSLEPVMAAPTAAQPGVKVSPLNAQLLISMADYTARYQLSSGAWVSVGRELTPLAVLGSMDAVRSSWDTQNNGWLISPYVRFAPAASQNEQLVVSNLGTQFQASRGLWIGAGTGTPPYTLRVYWGSGFESGGFNNLYQPTATIGSGVAVINGPSAGAIGPGNAPVFFSDPRTGRITFTQFEVSELIPINAGQNVYPLFYPSRANQSTLASLSGGAAIHPQIMPYSESVLIGTPADFSNSPTTATLYQRQSGSVDTGSINNNPAATTAYQVASGAMPLGAGTYAINYTCSPDISTIPAPAPAIQPYLGLSATPPNPADEEPVIEIPRPGSSNDPRVQAGNEIKVTYRFTFSTLDAAGSPVAHAVANYSSQRFVHVSVGLRAYDASSSQAHDYSLSTSVSSANPADEQPTAE